MIGGSNFRLTERPTATERSTATLRKLVWEWVCGMWVRVHLILENRLIGKTGKGEQVRRSATRGWRRNHTEVVEEDHTEVMGKGHIEVGRDAPTRESFFFL